MTFSLKKVSIATLGLRYSFLKNSTSGDRNKLQLQQEPKTAYLIKNPSNNFFIKFVNSVYKPTWYKLVRISVCIQLPTGR